MQSPAHPVPRAPPLAAGGGGGGALTGPQCPALQSRVATRADHMGAVTLSGTECPEEAPPAWAQALAPPRAPPTPASSSPSLGGQLRSPRGARQWD